MEYILYDVDKIKDYVLDSFKPREVQGASELLKALDYKPKNDEKNEEEKKEALLRDLMEEREFDKVAGLYEVLYKKNNLRPVPLCREPKTLYNTKIAIGRELQKSSDGLLYSMELIPQGTVFSGFVIRAFLLYLRSGLQKTLFLLHRFLIGYNHGFYPAYNTRL